jgi:hypothetical protein
VIRDEIVRIRIPPMVRDGAVIDVALDAIGITNLYLRLHAVVREHPSPPLIW